MNVDILFLIISSRKYVNTRQAVLKETWLQNAYYNFLSDYQGNSSDLDFNLLMSNNDDYLGCAEKVSNGLKFASKQNYSWFFICDDDAFVNTKNLSSFIKTCDPSCSYGLILDKKNSPTNPIWGQYPKLKHYFSGGAGILLSQKTIIEMNKINLDRFYGVGWSDLAIGLILQEIDAKMVSDSRFNSLAPHNYNHDLDTILSNITYHYITEDIMRWLYQNSLKPNDLPTSVS